MTLNVREGAKREEDSAPFCGFFIKLMEWDFSCHGINRRGSFVSLAMGVVVSYPLADSAF